MSDSGNRPPGVPMKYLLALLLLLAGCTQTVAPSTGPTSQLPSAPSSGTATPSATPICSPMGGTPVPCSAEEYRKVEEQNRLTEEAIALYRRWTKESTRLYRAGGTNKATPEMLATTAGEFQASALGIFRRAKAKGVRAAAGELKIVQIQPDHESSRPGIPAIQTCVDGRSLQFQSGTKVIGNGTVAKEYITAKRVNGALRLWSIESEVVAAC